MRVEENLARFSPLPPNATAEQKRAYKLQKEQIAEQVAEHEAKVTASIHNLYEIALKEKDYAAQVMLQWFITEQVEEEKNAA